MLYKFVERKAKLYVVMIIVGIVLGAFGVVKAITLPETAHIASRVMGMITGIGFSFACLGIIQLVRYRISTPEKLKLKQIEQYDERNIQITRIAYTISSLSATIMLVGLVFLFTIMGSITESYICLVAILIQSGIFISAYHYYRDKM